MMSVTEPRAPLQSAAIPYRVTAAGNLEVLLVTSRRKGRWVCPKGKVKKSISASVSAAAEAFEEAGVVGIIADHAIARYDKARTRGGQDLIISMQMFALKVETEATAWPEMHQRSRRWMTVPQALSAVEDKNLRAALRTLSEELTTAEQTSTDR